MSRHILADQVTTKDYWFAVTLIYAGVDLVSVTLQNGKAFEFCIICPKFDYDTYYNEWHRGELAVSDAKAFSQVATRISHIVRDVKRSGSYTNPDFVELIRDYENDKNGGNDGDSI